MNIKGNFMIYMDINAQLVTQPIWSKNNIQTCLIFRSNPSKLKYQPLYHICMK